MSTAPSSTPRQSAGLLRRRRERKGAFVPLPWTVVVPAVLFLIAFMALPLLHNLWRSVGMEQVGGNYYNKLFFDTYYLRVSLNTILLSVAVTVVCLILGYPIAYFMVRKAGRWRGLIVFFLIAPLLTSIIMRTFGWRVLLARRGLVNTYLLELGIIDAPLRMLDGSVVVVVGLVHLMIPFMVLSIAAVLQSMNPRLEESAYLLGASRLSVFLRITLPLSLDGIATGTILVFMLALGSFVTLQLLGGGAFQTLPLLIYQQFTTTQDMGFATAISNVLVVMALICLFLQMRYIRRRGVQS